VQAARADGLVILVAEDNTVNQEVLRQQLAILGYDCDIAPTGHAALKALGERSYPLLLCDCHMPGMDGFELTRVIRNKEASGDSRMPIVAVTANAMPGEATRCKAAGMDDYLAKPIEIGALQAKLNRWIGPARAQPVWTGAAPATRIEASEPTLDLRSLTVVYGNDPARLAPVIEQWTVAMKEVLRELDASITAQAWDTAVAAAHRIKGSAGVAGAARLSAAAAALEVALHGRDAVTIERDCERVRALTMAGLKEAAEWRRKSVPAANDHAALSEKAASGLRI
jgi:CheY-like chemotaxis protein/HPt (histidine-containing phosphotransfer) domain-containing protein